MKSIKQQYIDLKEGRMSQANFMRNLRMSMPQYVTNITSFNDSVKILRNKGILSEAEIRMTSYRADASENLNELFFPKVEQDIKNSISKGYSYDEAVELAAAAYDITPEEIETMIPRDAVDIEGHEEEDEEDAIMAAIKKYEEEEAGKYTTGGEQFEMNEEVTDPAILFRDPLTLAKAVAEKYGKKLLPLFNTRKKPGGYKKFESAVFQKAGEIATEAGMNPKVFTHLISFDEDWAMDFISAIYKELEKGEFGNNVDLYPGNMGDEISAPTSLEEGWTNTSGKSMYDQFKEIDNLNSQEVLIGIDAEMERNHELTKKEATKIVIKKLKKNPNYYTMEYLAGTEGYKAEYIGGKSAQPEAHQMQYLDKNMSNVVDKKMGMQPVKGIEKPKKDSETATAQKFKTSGISLMSLIAKSVRGLKKMDATGEKMKTIKLNEGGEHTTNWDFTTAQKDKIKQFIDDAEFDVDEQEDTVKTTVSSEKHASENIKHAIRKAIGSNSPSKVKPGIGDAIQKPMKESAEDRLAEQISQYIKETFDGRDNLTDVTGENQ